MLLCFFCVCQILNMGGVTSTGDLCSQMESNVNATMLKVC
jgi:hypothetical protein